MNAIDVFPWRTGGDWCDTDRFIDMAGQPPSKPRQHSSQPKKKKVLLQKKNLTAEVGLGKKKFLEAWVAAVYIFFSSSALSSSTP
jgi:hypothetical protein